MKYIKLRDLDSRISLGAMGMSRSYTGAGSDDAASIRTIQRALDLCVTLLNTTEIYGCGVPKLVTSGMPAASATAHDHGMITGRVVLCI